MPGKNAPETAYAGAIFKTIPTARASIVTGAASAQASLAAYVGKWIWLEAQGSDVRVMAGTHTLTAGQGFPLKVGADPIDFFVDKGDTASHTLAHLAAGVGTIQIFYDAD